MAYDISLSKLWLYPTIPHDLMHIKGVLRNTHRIRHATGAIVRLTTMMCIGIREDNLHTTRRHARACARTLTPIIIPATHHLDSKLIHIVVIIRSRFPTIQRSLSFFMIGVTIRIPVFAQALIATILHRPHRMLFRLVDV